MTDEERTILAGEYVLGTLSLAERRRVESLRAGDERLDAEIGMWEHRLGPLGAGAAEIAPPAGILERVLAEIDAGSRPAGARPDARTAGQPVRPPSAAPVWLAGIIALCLGLGGGYMARPLFDPAAAPAGDGSNYVAVVNRDAGLPALIVRVDLASGTVSVRPVAAEKPDGSDLELWYVAPGAQPRSLGVIDAEHRVTADLDLGSLAENSVLAVSVEPAGGSATGAPTGPVVYSGQLIRD
ncbi:anti-sigma factor [Stappia sp.]|uniref:anti-sigma factor n=1 Tax=Stappia sp. TaxID=1870903 RepID=UPI003D112DEB